MHPIVEAENSGSVSDQRLTEIQYHQKLNRWLVLFALPFYLFFMIFWFSRGNIAQGVIFSLLYVDAIVSYLLGLRIKRLDHMLLNKQVGTAIAFSLLAASIIIGMMSDDIYISYPWALIYPVGVLLMFGERIGIIFALGFCLVTTLGLYMINFPPLDESAVRMFKLNSFLVLMACLSVALIAERTRVRMRNSLIEARNKYKAAEERQRRTNEELKGEIKMRVQSERALSQSEARYRTLFEESSVSLWEENLAKVKEYLDGLSLEAVADLEGYLLQNPSDLSRCLNSIWVTAVNRAALKLYGAVDLKELLKKIEVVLPSDVLGYLARRITDLYNIGVFNTQLEAQTLQGRKLHLLVSSTIPAGYEQSWEKVFTSVYDITERVSMEEEKKRVDQQLQHTRQIQAIASLAGGIAHQFNNALAVISGNLDLLELNLKDDQGNLRHIGALRASSDRITRLTEQLLAYAQGGKYQPRDFLVKNLVEEVLNNSKTVRKSSYQVNSKFEEDVYLAGGDITQIRMVLEAVLANAAEAMENGGEIDVTVRHSHLEVAGDPEPVLPPGDYALITIADHGIGMDEETRRRIFEPFFTTKFVGRGLGMAAAYGVVRNHEGIIEVASAPNQGTQVMIYLPSTSKPLNTAIDPSIQAT